VKTYSIVLSTTQTYGTPDLINHYIFVDPVLGTNFTYPISADGSRFTTTTGTFVYPFTAQGGNFFPWGYIITNTLTFLTAGPFKGPYTITFVPSAVDTTYYPLLKIVYDFGDGTSQSVERSIASTTDAANPKTTSPAHDYWPASQIKTTYNPSVSVVNGSSVVNIFNITFDMYHDSLYEFGDYHLLDSLQLSKSFNRDLKVIEVTDPEYVTLFKYATSIEGLIAAI
jgi:hypothetical protein